MKIGSPVILLRNIDQSKDLCNGQRLQIEGFGDHSIKVSYLTGRRKGQVTSLFRITFIPDDKNLGFTMNRHQFPIRLAFAMIINKSQSATIKDRLGIYLPNPVFGHGQLYVAFSRTVKKENVKVLVKDIKDVQGRFEDGHVYTRNVVYHEAFSY